MVLIQMSDFHVNQQTDLNEIKNRIKLYITQLLTNYLLMMILYFVF